MVEVRGASRRGFVVAALGAVVGGCAVEGGRTAIGADDSRTPMATPTRVPATRPVVSEPPVADGNEALRRLLAGNRRYASGGPWQLNETVARRREVADGQQPFATVLTCVDSRVPPELLFDRGLGDLVVVRSAGTVLDHSVLGSVEFGVAELRTPLLLVLGHERCGAVDAAIRDDGGAHGSIRYLVDRLRPVVDEARGRPGDLLDNAVVANVRATVAALRRSPVLADAVRHRSVRITGARYDLDTGLVTLVR
jgi:carbonic anhydrase